MTVCKGYRYSTRAMWHLQHTLQGSPTYYSPQFNGVPNDAKVSNERFVTLLCTCHLYLAFKEKRIFDIIRSRRWGSAHRINACQRELSSRQKLFTKIPGGSNTTTMDKLLELRSACEDVLERVWT